jgi:hypothetical protein
VISTLLYKVSVSTIGERLGQLFSIELHICQQGWNIAHRALLMVLFSLGGSAVKLSV